MDKGDSSPFAEIGVNPVGEFVTDNSFVGVENKAMGFVKEEVIGIEVELGRDFCLDGFIELCVKCPVRKLVLTSCICRKGFNYGVINPDHPPRMLVRSRCGGGKIPLRQGVEKIGEPFPGRVIEGQGVQGFVNADSRNSRIFVILTNSRRKIQVTTIDLSTSDGGAEPGFGIWRPSSRVRG